MNKQELDLLNIIKKKEAYVNQRQLSEVFWLFTW